MAALVREGVIKSAVCVICARNELNVETKGLEVMEMKHGNDEM